VSQVMQSRLHITAYSRGKGLCRVFRTLDVYERAEAASAEAVVCAPPRHADALVELGVSPRTRDRRSEWLRGRGPQAPRNQRKRVEQAADQSVITFDRARAAMTSSANCSGVRPTVLR
jgi:hypothetical protein